ncbi:MAG: EamA family transporter, partial [Gemmatimonadetes bacterium]
MAPLILLIGLQKTASSTASLLLNLEGVFTTLLAWLIFG